MAITNKLKQFWKYLNTSHGTHQEVVPYGYGFTSIPPPEYIDVPNQTPFQNIQKIVLTSALVGILGGMCLWGRSCILEERKARERKIPSPEALKLFVRLKEDSLNNIEKYKAMGISTGLEELKMENADELIEFCRKDIKEKIEKGYLTPQDIYWNDYKAVFGNEHWWPKDVNN